MASVPFTVLLYNGPLLCGFNVPIKGLRNWKYWPLYGISIAMFCPHFTTSVRGTVSTLTSGGDRPYKPQLTSQNSISSSSSSLYLLKAWFKKQATKKLVQTTRTTRRNIAHLQLPQTTQNRMQQRQEVQLSQRDRATLCVIEYFAQSLKITQA